MALLPELFDEFYEPEPRMTVSEWSDAYRVLVSRSAAEPGQYRTSRTPYLRAIMDDLSARSNVHTVIFKKAAQIGASEMGNNWTGYIIDQAPGPMLLVQPNIDLAKRYSRQRIETLIESSDRLRTKVAPARHREAGNTMLVKEFVGGILVITGANSAVGLRSMPIRFLFLDEIDAYPPDVDEEGDPVALAEARTRTFGLRAKRFKTSTPKMKGSSRISDAYAATDQRRYFVPCPLCGEKQFLDFARLHWPPGKHEEVRYQCIACEELFAEHHKTKMLDAGEWQATGSTDDPYTHGYHLSALYSPIGWFSWSEIAQQWEKAAGDADLRKTFVNTVLGEEWEEEADAIPDWQRLYERREDWHHATVPEHGLFLTAGADVQADRIEVDVWAWGRSLESWLVEHIVIMGDTSHEATWNQVSQLLGRTWEHSSGRRMALQRFAIDTGGFTSEVYKWVRNQDRALVLPVKGMPAYDRLVPVSGPTRIESMPNGERLKRGINLFTVSVSFFKKELYKQLNLTKPTDEQLAEGLRYPAGFVHLSRSVSDEWVQQLVAEQQVIVRNRRGFATKTEWRQLRARNEAMDCRVYARAAVWLAGADRWSETRWRDLEDQLGLEKPTAPRVEPIMPVPAPLIRPAVTEQIVGTPQTPIGGMIARRPGRRVIF
jgi:phage terminase large subunit GpA-like protein